MATEEVKIVIDVEGGNAKKTVGDFKKELKQAASEGKKVSDSVKKVGTEGLSVKARLKQLKDEMSAIGNVGSPQFQKLAAEAGKLKDQMNNANSAIKSMSSDFPRLQTGIQAFQGIGAAAQFAAGAQLLFGNENKEVQKAMQRAMALTTMMSSVQAIANTLSDEAIVGQKLRMLNQKLLNKQIVQQAVATKTATTAQKIMNVVMKANPIMLIVSGVALLITGLIALGKNVQKVGDFFIWLRDIVVKDFSDMLLMFGLIDEAIETQSMKEREAFEKRTAQQKEIAKQNQDRLDAIKKERDALEAEHIAKQEEFDFEIKINKLLGKSNKELTTQKLEDNLLWAEEQKRLTLEALDSWTKYYEDLFVLSGKSREDFAAQMKGQGIDLELLEQEKVNITEEANDQIRLADAELTSFKIENARKAQAEQDKIDKENAAKAKKLLDRKIKAQAELDKMEIDAIENKYEKERALALAKFEKDIANLDANIEEENELIKAKKLKLQEDLRAIDVTEYEEQVLIEIEREFAELERIKAYEDEKSKIEKEAQDKRDADQEAARKVALQGAQDLLNATEKLANFQSAKELKRAQEKVKRGEALTDLEVKRLKRQDKINKAFALAQIAADTARGIASAVASGSALPFPANLGAIASGVAAVISGSVQAAQVMGESVEIPQVEAGGADLGGLGGAASGATEGRPDNDFDFGSTILNQEQQPVLVVESVTEGINSVSVIESLATFG